MKKYTLKLRSVGNPDIAQYAPVSNPRTVHVNTLREASEACRAYIKEWDLGGGNWPKAHVHCNGKPVAWISYNGRVWDMKGNEITL
jgi:hypothetical protein